MPGLDGRASPAAGPSSFTSENDGEGCPELRCTVNPIVPQVRRDLAAVCVDAVEPELVDWLKAKGIEIVDIPFKDAMELGCNVVALGKGRVLLPSTSKTLKEKCLALGLKVYDPDISMIAKGGGGVHCMCQPLRRDPV